MPLEVIPVTTDEQRQCVYALRYNVFITEQKSDPDLEVDEYDTQPNTFHFLGRDAETGEFVATARCTVFANERKGKVGRVVVLSDYRGKRYGAALMAAVEAAVRDQCDYFVLSAQCDKCAFYEKCGYSRVDDETYFEGHIPHCMMSKRVRG